MELAMVTAMGVGMENLLWAMIITGVPGYARFVRATVINLTDLEYIQCARSYGTNNFIIRCGGIFLILLDATDEPFIFILDKILQKAYFKNKMISTLDSLQSTVVFLQCCTCLFSAMNLRKKCVSRLSPRVRPPKGARFLF